MSQAKPCIEYDPACVECRRDAGKDAAGTTWQCVGHVCLERDALRELMNVYNIGGWTDALVPVQRALKAEAERDAALAERDRTLKVLELERQARQQHEDGLKSIIDEQSRENATLASERDEARTEVYSLRQMVETWHVRAEAHRQANEATTLALTEARRVLVASQKGIRVLEVMLNASGLAGADIARVIDADIAAVLAQEEAK